MFESKIKIAFNPPVLLTALLLSFFRRRRPRRRRPPRRRPRRLRRSPPPPRKPRRPRPRSPPPRKPLPRPRRPPRPRKPLRLPRRIKSSVEEGILSRCSFLPSRKRKCIHVFPFRIFFRGAPETSLCSIVFRRGVPLGTGPFASHSIYISR